jgi:hypothetical protein
LESAKDVDDVASEVTSARIGDDRAVDRAKQYRYTLGEAIAFGDGFVHATETGSAPHQLAFLCFTFGLRQCTEAQWSNAKAYIAEQGPIHQDPWRNLVNNSR